MADKKPDSSDLNAQTDLPDGDASVNTSRRRLTGAGLGMSAIFTLASRPVLAVQCTSPSAAASGNLSTHGTPPQCTGRTPGYWKNKQHAGAWPTGYSQGTCNSDNNGCSNSPANWSGGTTFHPELSGTTFIKNSQSLTMNQVMVLSEGSNSYLGLTDKYNLGSHIVAALLNAASGKTVGVLTVAQVKAMWTECQTGDGYFEPTAGVKWTAAQVVTYLQTTMTV